MLGNDVTELDIRLRKLHEKYCEKRFLGIAPKGNRAMRLAARLVKATPRQLREFIMLDSDPGQISNGLAQSLLYMKGGQLTDFKGQLAGAYITSRGEHSMLFKGLGAGMGAQFGDFHTDLGSYNIIFEGDFAGARTLFIGLNSGENTKFIGSNAGRNAEFRGTEFCGAGKNVLFKGKCAGMNTRFIGLGSGNSSKFKGEYAGTEADFFGSSAGCDTIFDGDLVSGIKFSGWHAGQRVKFVGMYTGSRSEFNGEDAGKDINLSKEKLRDLNIRLYNH